MFVCCLYQKKKNKKFFKRCKLINLYSKTIIQLCNYFLLLPLTVCFFPSTIEEWSWPPREGLERQARERRHPRIRKGLSIIHTYKHIMTMVILHWFIIPYIIRFFLRRSWTPERARPPSPSWTRPKSQWRITSKTSLTMCWNRSTPHIHPDLQ